nr:hypothetical protein Iba_chr02bCG3180 [Ipomoea batatas]
MHRPLGQSNAGREEVPAWLIQIYGSAVWFCVNMMAAAVDGFTRSPSFPVAKLVVLSSLLQVKKDSSRGYYFENQMVVALGGSGADKGYDPQNMGIGYCNMSHRNSPQ